MFRPPVAAGIGILCVGDVMYDVYEVVVRDGHRVSRELPHGPGAGRWREVEGRRIELPGGVATLARCVSGLGFPVECHFALGSEEAPGQAARFLAGLDAMGVSVHPVTESRPMARKRRTLLLQGDTQQELWSVERGSESAIRPEVEARLLAGIQESPRANVFVVADFGRGGMPPSLVRAVGREAERRGALLIADFHPQPLEWLKEYCVYSTLLKLNSAEAAYALGLESGGFPSDEDMHAAGVILEQELATNVLITADRGGAWLYSSDRDPEHFPALNQDPVCVVGAGDSLVATAAVWLSMGASLQEAILAGTKAAAITVGKPGTGVAQRSDLAGELEVLFRRSTHRPHHHAAGSSPTAPAPVYAP